MTKYERMTERKENGYINIVCEHCEYNKNNKCDINTHYCHLAVKESLAELEDKIENGTLIDITEKFITEEEIKNKTRYLICEHYLTKMAVDFADNKAEAEAKLKELQENEQ